MEFIEYINHGIVIKHENIQYFLMFDDFHSRMNRPRKIMVKQAQDTIFNDLNGSHPQLVAELYKFGLPYYNLAQICD